MATRKEEKAQRRSERLEQERREAEAARRRLILGYIVAGGLCLTVLVGIVIVVAGSGGSATQVNGKDVCASANVQLQSGSTNDLSVDCREGTPPDDIVQADLNKAAAAANCDLKLNLPDEGNTHIEPSDPVPDYQTNPPTSGNHVRPPLQQADGAYSKAPGPQYVVHSLEHGRIEIQYAPDLADSDQLALKGVFDESPDGMLLFPNPDMPYEVAATAWTQLLGCPKYEGQPTLDAIRDFRDIYRGQGPEAGIPISLGG